LLFKKIQEIWWLSAFGGPNPPLCNQAFLSFAKRKKVYGLAKERKGRSTVYPKEKRWCCQRKKLIKLIFMKQTGPMKLETRRIISTLEEKGKKEKQKIFSLLAEQLSKPSRQMAEVNLSKLSKLAKANAKKILVVPGKVLSSGNAETGMEISAFRFSAEAKKKIVAAKGKALTLMELADGKAKPSEMLLVK
jgi:large subunit ribosomal protein L18e